MPDLVSEDEHFLGEISPTAAQDLHPSGGEIPLEAATLNDPGEDERFNDALDGTGQTQPITAVVENREHWPADITDLSDSSVRPPQAIPS